MCFGGSGSHLVGGEQAAAENRANVSNQALQGALPFYQNLTANGLPFMGALQDYTGGTMARAAAPGRAALNRRFAQAGIGPNDPRALQGLGDYNANIARGFDQAQTQNLFANQAAKLQGAQGLGQIAAISDPAEFFRLWQQYLGQNSMFGKAGQFAGGFASGAAGGA